MRGIAGTRIWYQSFTDPDADRPYFTRLKDYLGSVASPGCQVEAFGIQPGARYPGPITDFRCAAQAIANAHTELAQTLGSEHPETRAAGELLAQR